VNDKIPKPTTPFIDPRSGNIAREWVMYLASLDGPVQEDILFWSSLHT
jgi:hypothetical protein